MKAPFPHRWYAVWKNGNGGRQGGERSEPPRFLMSVQRALHSGLFTPKAEGGGWVAMAGEQGARARRGEYSAEHGGNSRPRSPNPPKFFSY